MRHYYIIEHPTRGVYMFHAHRDGDGVYMPRFSWSKSRGEGHKEYTVDAAFKLRDRIRSESTGPGAYDVVYYNGSSYKVLKERPPNGR